MIDAHNHFGQYRDQERQVADLPAGMIVVAVTNSPAEFRALEPRFGRHRQVRLAVGFHPAFTDKASPSDLRAFDDALSRTSFVGEVGLDFGLPRAGWPAQERALHGVLQRAQRKVVSVHSRRAEARTLEFLLEHSIVNAVFHWYSGPLGVLDRILDAGFYCSVGPAMIRSAKGRRIVARLPRDRVLVETDGPYVSVAGRPAVPADAGLVYAALSRQWVSPQSELTTQLWHNFSALCARLEHSDLIRS